MYNHSKRSPNSGVSSKIKCLSPGQTPEDMCKAHDLFPPKDQFSSLLTSYKSKFWSLNSTPVFSLSLSLSQPNTSPLHILSTTLLSLDSKKVSSFYLERNINQRKRKRTLLYCNNIYVTCLILLFIILVIVIVVGFCAFSVRRRKKEEMERKVMEYCEAAKRAAEAAEEEVEERRCIDALNHLKNMSITSHLLVSTQAARHLRPQRKHPRKRIKDFASDLIVSWKRMFIEQTKRDERNGICNNSVEVVEPPNRETTTKIKKVQMTSLEIKVRKTDQISSLGSKKAMRSETVVAGEKISSTENVIVETTTVVAAPKLNSMIKCNDGLRDAIREKLYEALSEADDEEIRHEVNAIDPIRVAVSVESVMFENWGNSNGTQKTNYRSILFNLKDQKNPDFRRKVILGHVKPDTLVNMSAEEIASDERQWQNQQIKEKALFDCELGSAPKATTDQFKCSRCEQRKTTNYQMQTRSADEPMTTYVTCVNCNNHWKFC